MPRYTELNIDKTTPISFGEMLAPLELYKQEYEKEATAYEQLLDKVSELRKLNQAGVDAGAYNTFSEYQQKLDELGDAIYSGRLDIPGLMELRRGYHRDIAPLEAALKKRNQLVGEQLKNSGPNIMFDTDYSTVPLDQINESSSYRTYDLSKIEGTIANTLAQKYIANGYNFGNEDEELKEVIGALDLSGLNTAQKAKIWNTGISARNAAIKAAQDYKAQQEYTQSRTYANLNKNTKSSRGGSSSSSSGSPVGRGEEIFKQTLPSGETVTLVRAKNGDGYRYWKTKNVNGKIKKMEEIGSPEEASKDWDSTGLKYRGLLGKYRGGVVDGDGNPAKTDDSSTKVKSILSISDLASTTDDMYSSINVVLRALAAKNKVSLEGLFVNGYMIVVGQDSDGEYTVEIKRKPQTGSFPSRIENPNLPQPENEIPDDSSLEG